MAEDFDFDYDISPNRPVGDNVEDQEEEDEEEEEGVGEDTGGSDEAALRAALHFQVGEICSAETAGKPMTGSAVSTLAEVCRW